MLRTDIIPHSGIPHTAWSAPRQGLQGEPAEMVPLDDDSDDMGLGDIG